MNLSHPDITADIRSAFRDEIIQDFSSAAEYFVIPQESLRLPERAMSTKT